MRRSAGSRRRGRARHAPASAPAGLRAGGTAALAFSLALLGRNRGLAQPDRVVRRVLLASGRRTRELDQMMRDRGRTDQSLEIAAPEPPDRELPEYAPVVAEHADLPEDIAQHDQRAPDVGPGLQFRRDRHLDAVGVGVVALILVAR